MKITFEVDSVDELIELRNILNDLSLPENDILSCYINNTGMAHRTCGCLKSEGLITVRDILKYSEYDLLTFPNLGRKALNEIKDYLKLHGLIIKPR